MIEIQHKDSCSLPLLVCDLCGNPIDDVEQCMYVFELEMSGRTPVQVVHKGFCDRKLEQKLGYRMQGSVEIAALPIYLLRNLNVTYTEAKRVAAYYSGRERSIDLLRGRTNGYVYILRFEKLYKIGCTRSLQNRISQLQAALPGPSELVHSIECEDHRNIEGRLHKNLKEFWVKGEWFELPEWVISDLKEIRYA